MTAQRGGEKRDLTLAKGLGILLVVAGHLLGQGTSAGNAWFTEATRAIYLFHMPFFMYLSGYVFFRPGRMAVIERTYGAFVRKQSLRLLLPFLAMGVGVVGAKFFAQGYLSVDRAPSGLGDGLVALLWHTGESPAKFVWYVFVLYVFNLIAPWVHRWCGARMGVLVGIGLVLYILPPMSVLYVNYITQFFVFFALGGWARQHEEMYERALDRGLFLWILVFGGSFFLRYGLEFGERAAALGVGAASLPAIHAVCRWLESRGTGLARGFYTLGGASYAIYLLNAPFVSLGKAVVFRTTGWDGGHLYWVAPLLIVIGAGAPWALQRWVLGRVPFIRDRILAIKPRG